MDSFLLDTHAWIWLQEGFPSISADIVKTVDAARRNDRLFVSAVSVWEIGNLEIRGRVRLHATIEEWLRIAFTIGRLQLLSLDAQIALASTRLPEGLHRDPADRMLAATTRIHNLTLLTRDQSLLDYGRKGHLRVRKI